MLWKRRFYAGAGIAGLALACGCQSQTRVVPIGPNGTATLNAQGGYTSYAVDSGSGPIDTQRVTITNQREVPVSVRLTRPGWPDLTSAETILASILREGMSDEAKALAIYSFFRDWRSHWHPPDAEDNHDPVKMVGVYGYGYCDDAARSLDQLARKAGLKARVWELQGHVVSEVFYEGRWHMLDVDLGKTYQHPLGHLASVEEIARNPHWIADPDVRGVYASTENNVVSPSLPSLSHELRLPLHPGDSATFATGKADAPPPAAVRRPRAVLGDPPPPVYGVGRLVRRLAPGDHLVEIPYVLLGGRIKAATCCLRGSVAFGDWRPHQAVDLSVDAAGKLANLGQLVAAQGAALYQVWLNVNAPVDLELDFQFAPRSIPWLTPGTAQFEVFVENLQPETCTKTGDACQGDEGVEIVHEVEVRRPELNSQTLHIGGARETGPEVEAVALNAPAVGDTFERGETVEATVTFDRLVDVTGTPQLALGVGSNTRQASYASGDGTDSLVFRYELVQADVDPDGISIAAAALTLNSGTIRLWRSTRNAVLGLGDHAIADSGDHKVDGAKLTRPKIDEVFFRRAPANDDTYRFGERIDLSIDFDRAVAVTGTPQLALTIGQQTKQLPLFRLVGTTRLRFRHVVEAGDFDADGVSVFEGALTLNGGAVNDARDPTVAADIRLGRHAFTNTSQYKVDSQAGPASSAQR